MHSVHTLSPGCAHGARWASCVAPFRGLAPLIVSQALAVVSQLIGGHVVAWLAVSQAHPCAVHGCIVAWLCCIATQPVATSLPHCHDTILYRDTIPPTASPFSSASLSRYSRLYRDMPSQPSQPPITIHPRVLRHDFLSSHPSHVTIQHTQAAPLAIKLLPTRLCHDTIFHCIVTQFGQ